MKRLNEISKEYESLCQQLGDLVCNKDKMEKRMKEIKDRIEYLNNLVVDLQYAEKMEKL